MSDFKQPVASMVTNLGDDNKLVEVLGITAQTNWTTMNESQPLFQGTGFEVVAHGDSMVVVPTTTKVFVIPYVLDGSGMLDMVGVHGRTDLSTPTLISGEIATNDPDVLSAAMNVITDVSGLRVRGEDKWLYLGILRIRGIADESYPCFAVDMTNETTEEMKKDSENGFFFLSVPKTVETDDVLLQAAFLKLFRHYYNQL